MERSNEELAIAIQQGDSDAAEQLIRQNKGLLAKWAIGMQKRRGLHKLTDDLMQEGSIALLAAAKTYDPDRGTRLMTYAGAAIQQEMRDYADSCGSAVHIPLKLLRRLRRAAYLETEDAIAGEFGISAAEAKRLRALAAELLTCGRLETYNNTPSEFGIPESVYEKQLLTEHISELVDALSAREQTLVRYYYGLGDHCGDGMTLEELAIRLNYNGPSGAQKALDKALSKLRKNFMTGSFGAWKAAKELLRQAK